MPASGLDPFLAALGSAGRQRLGELGRPQRHAAGTRLFNEGDPSVDVLVIRRGQVKVLTAGSLDGHELVLAIRGPGALVGELASLEDGPRLRSASVVAVTDVEVQRIPNADFLRFVETQPHALVALTRMLISRLHDADRRSAELGALATLPRLARALTHLVEQAAPGDALTFPLTQDELAAMIGASRESVVRALRKLRERRLVATGRGRVVVLDAGGLARLAP